jgi:DNA polymerase-4
MHLDINSCFASVEQLYNPALIGKPVAVAAYKTDHGCVLAASREAKKFGVKTGMRVFEGRKICPQLTVLESDPPKYRAVHQKLKKILLDYHEAPVAKSIDEFVLELNGYPAFRVGMINTAREIKERIKQEIGMCLTVSIGISTNRYLAKVGSNLQKPDGLVEINKDNYSEIFGRMKLTDLSGIKKRNAMRLYRVGIKNVNELYSAPVAKLKAAFNGICGYYWFLRIHGFEIDDVVAEQKSFGAQYVLPKVTSDTKEILAILQKLVEKMGKHLRFAGKQAKGIHLAVLYGDHTWFHRGENMENYVFSSRDFFEKARNLLFTFPPRNGVWGQVREIAVSCFNISSINNLQYELFSNTERKNKLTRAMDKINQKFGDYVISPANLLLVRDAVPDRIAFGH